MSMQLARFRGLTIALASVHVASHAQIVPNGSPEKSQQQ